MGRSEISECVRIAGTQYGIIGREQANTAGVSTRVIQRLVSERVWTRVRPKVFAVWIPSTKSDLWRHRLKAGELWLGAQSAISHRASSMLWELDGVGSAPLEHITTRNLRSPVQGLVIHRVTDLPLRHVKMVAGFRVTSVPRTLIDLASMVPARTLELALESSLRLRLTTSHELRQELMGTSPNQPGKGVLRELLGAHPGAPTESAFETMGWQFFRDEGLPLPERQFRACDERGRVVARIDFAYPDAKLAIEFDGLAGHSSPADLRRDRHRQNALVRMGWTVYRITWKDLMHRGDIIAEDIRRLLTGSLAQIPR